MTETRLIFYRGLVYGVIASLFLGFVVPTQSATEAAIVTQLLGFTGTFPSKNYSGYVTIDENLGNNLFYYFVDSEWKPMEERPNGPLAEWWTWML